MKKKTLTLCADDFGQNKEISEGIIQLLQHSRLSATSCMTNMPDWRNEGPRLLEFKDQIDIGLHFNLTDGKALTPDAQNYFGSLSQLMIKAYLKQINPAWIEQELRAQLNAFIDVIGSPPDFIDGHQHIHHLPVIRDVLLKVYQDFFDVTQPYIRISSNSWAQSIRQSLRCWKIFIISMTGALKLKKALIKLGIPHNQTFSGIYSFSAKTVYRKQFQQFLQEIENHGLIMCHPGLSGDSADPIYHTRQQEWDYLRSAYFLEDMTDIQLDRQYPT